MTVNPIHITPEELAAQRAFAARVRTHYEERFIAPMALVRTFGCQQNVTDSERIRGMLAEMGFGFTEDTRGADVILLNTCAVREHAEDRVLGHLGALKAVKRARPHTVIGMCGCMAQEAHVADKLRASYPHVGLVFGTHALHRLPELLWRALTDGRVAETAAHAGVIAEGLPLRREGDFKAFVPIMYGCDNFCSYCVVPYVRGRERSREAARVLAEVRELAAAGYKEITLLGQNVNSYRGMEGGFPALLRAVNAVEGDFLIRFMTSHPKDATPALFDAIAACDKVERHFHLPFQAGSDRVLAAMNRGYTRAGYLELIAQARRAVSDIVFTGDVIVGFPGETREDFEQTLSLVREVGFQSLFTFLFSPRRGTPAAEMDDPVSAEEKGRRFAELLAVQEAIGGERAAALVGQRRRALIEAEADGVLEARTGGNVVIRVPGGDAAAVGRWAEVAITASRGWTVEGRLVAEGEHITG